MDFLEAENRFRWLEEQVRGGRLTEPQYRAALAELRVVDPSGRTWMQQEHTGVWYVYQNGQWSAAQPPRTAPPPPQYAPPMPPPAPAPQSPYQSQPQPVAYSAPAGRAPGGNVVGKYLKYFLIWLVAWLVIGLGVFIFVAKDQPDVLYGVAAAAVISLLLMLGSLSGSWQGEVVEIYNVTETVDEDSTRDVTYAAIRQPNGKTRRERAMGDWRVGDWLVKRRGETYPQKGPRP